MMRQFVGSLRIPTPGRGLVEITREALDWLTPREVEIGLLTLFCRHTSAGLLVQENASADVRADLEAFLERLAPEAPGRYRHAEEGEDDMPAHIRADRRMRAADRRPATENEAAERRASSGQEHRAAAHSRPTLLWMNIR